jgi:hypothetical protein
VQAANMALRAIDMPASAPTLPEAIWQPW